jgi:hypothetical protein
VEKRIRIQAAVDVCDKLMSNGTLREEQRLDSSWLGFPALPSPAAAQGGWVLDSGLKLFGEHDAVDPRRKPLLASFLA